jgi:hypothetical protein
MIVAALTGALAPRLKREIAFGRKWPTKSQTEIMAAENAGDFPRRAKCAEAERRREATRIKAVEVR